MEVVWRKPCLFRIVPDIVFTAPFLVVLCWLSVLDSGISSQAHQPHVPCQLCVPRWNHRTVKKFDGYVCWPLVLLPPCSKCALFLLLLPWLTSIPCIPSRFPLASPPLTHLAQTILDSNKANHFKSLSYLMIVESMYSMKAGGCTWWCQGSQDRTDWLQVFSWASGLTLHFPLPVLFLLQPSCLAFPRWCHWKAMANYDSCFLLEP